MSKYKILVIKPKGYQEIELFSPYIVPGEIVDQAIGENLMEAKDRKWVADVIHMKG